ncbi:DUF2231 domain-containing protein [Kutzneria chonburiensis]|uniref:DUF2231 domain-containing protein n=1 Tax=Kutzneria chonburiensis TaxID=1483604 RepID=A0ABV6MNI4_9PSEU|nr:DUF2231 domain-containing protein [Kutzneria chonburiensis]
MPCGPPPAARRRLGIVTPVIALIALICVPVTTSAGEWLIRHVEVDPLVRAHAHLGDGLLPWVGGLFLLTAVVWALHRYRDRLARLRWLPVATVVVAVLSVAVSVGSVVEVYRIGDSGAQAAWHDNFSANPVSSSQK